MRPSCNKESKVGVLIRFDRNNAFANACDRTLASLASQDARQTLMANDGKVDRAGSEQVSDFQGLSKPFEEHEEYQSSLIENQPLMILRSCMPDLVGTRNAGSRTRKREFGIIFKPHNAQ